MRMPESRNIGVIIPAYDEAGIKDTLDALYHQEYQEGVGVIVIDNNPAADVTAAVVQKFQQEHDGFPLEIIEEEDKGTGKAADSGARYAIKQGYSYVARTDADTTPGVRWTRAIHNTLAFEPDKVLATGPVRVRRDADYRPGDNAIVAIGTAIAKGSRTILRRNLADLRAAAGLNMAFTAEAYEQAGGFPRTAIEECDEDLALTYAIEKEFGFGAMAYNPEITVDTSARRLRNLGYVGTLRYYLLEPSQRKAVFGEKIDFR